MEYRYSHAIDPKSYDNQGLCNEIPLRVHRNSDLDEAGTIRLRNDWRKYVGPLPLTSYGGNMGPIYSFTSVAIPECHPDRLQIVSYAMELGFLHDDLIDTSKTEEGSILNDQIMSGLKSRLEKSKENLKASGEGRILHNLMEELMALDPPRAKEVINYWKRDLGVRRDRTHFADFKDYLEYRIVDCGSFFLIALATFGMRLTIPADEKEECFRLTRPVWAAAALTNDVQSWDKECKLVETQDKTDMTNGVWVLMKQHSIDVDEAKGLILQMVREFVAEYVDTVKNIHHVEGLSLDSRRFVEAMQYMISGNLLWGISTPRYHPDCTLTDLQISRMKNGWPGDRGGAHEAKKGSNYLDCHKNEVNNDSTQEGTEQLHSGSLSTKGTCVSSSQDVFLTTNISSLSSNIICSPARYIATLPSKNIREKAIDSLNSWFSVTEGDTIKIKSIINLLHNASLLLDDVEDGSQLRRGKASTHTVFGPPQTINSAGYQIIEAMHQVRQLDALECLEIFEDEVRKLYIGQSYDLFWTHSTICPSIEDYIKMVDHKTGALFHLLAKLLTTMSSSPFRPDLTVLLTLLGRHFQIRDDYINLSSTEYMRQKGFCEDLDEGKYSLPIIHAIKNSSEDGKLLLRNILAQRRTTGHLSTVQKQLILDQLERASSLEYTKTVLGNLYNEIIAEIRKIERTCGTANPQFMGLVKGLEV